jgi:hypothetical protein
VQKKQMPFLAVAPRLAVRAVKGAPFAFTGAKRKPLTEEAHGLGAGFCQGREDREANDDRAKQQKRPRLCAGAESDFQSERSLVGLGRRLPGRIRMALGARRSGVVAMGMCGALSQTLFLALGVPAALLCVRLSNSCSLI